MKLFKKCAALATSAALAGSMLASCSNTKYAMTIDGYEVRAGIFIFYTISSYYEATEIISKDGTDVSNIDNVKNAMIDNISSTEWIQNKATEYCQDFVAVERKFDEIGAELSEEDEDEVESTLSYFLEKNEDLCKNNGISEESLRDILEYEHKWQYVFDYYYGFDSEKGMSEDELKDYYNDNYARVKYIKIDLKDSDGNLLKGDDKNKLIKLANSYADKVNAKSSQMDKLYEMNEVKEEYDTYVEEKAAEEAEAKGETTAATTTTTAVTTSVGQTTVTTTTNPYENETIIQLVTEASTTAAKQNENDLADETKTTTTASEVNYVPSKVTNDFIFNKAKIGVAEVVEEAEAVYVIFKADLYERMNADDLWNENTIQKLQLANYEEDFGDYLDEIVNTYTFEKNEKSYKRYSPFKLDFE